MKNEKKIVHMLPTYRGVECVICRDNNGNASIQTTVSFARKNSGGRAHEPHEVTRYLEPFTFQVIDKADMSSKPTLFQSDSFKENRPDLKRSILIIYNSMIIHRSYHRDHEDQH